MRKLKRYEFIIIITLLSLLMMLVSSFFITHKVYTSKVTWVENKGFPIRYLEYDGYYGPCGPEVEGRCKNLSLQDINYYYFLANLLFFVAISSLIVIGSNMKLSVSGPPEDNTST